MALLVDTTTILPAEAEALLKKGINPPGYVPGHERASNRGETQCHEFAYRVMSYSGLRAPVVGFGFVREDFHA